MACKTDVVGGRSLRGGLLGKGFINDMIKVVYIVDFKDYAHFVRWRHQKAALVKMIMPKRSDKISIRDGVRFGKKYWENSSNMAKR